MQIRVMLLTVSCLLFLSVTSFATDFDSVLESKGSFSHEVLAKEANKAIPSGFSLVQNEGDGESAFVSFQKQDAAYQFTLASDTDPQVMDAQSFEFKGKKALFFELGMETAAGLMIILGPEKSLTIVHMAGFDADPVTRKALVAVAEKMDLDKL